MSLHSIGRTDPHALAQTPQQIQMREVKRATVRIARQVVGRLFAKAVPATPPTASNAGRNGTPIVVQPMQSPLPETLRLPIIPAARVPQAVPQMAPQGEAALNLETAARDANLAQSLEPESFALGRSFTNRECPAPLQSDSNSRSCANLASRTAVSRLNLKTAARDANLAQSLEVEIPTLSPQEEEMKKEEMKKSFLDLKQAVNNLNATEKRSLRFFQDSSIEKSFARQIMDLASRTVNEEDVKECQSFLAPFPESLLKEIAFLERCSQMWPKDVESIEANPPEFNPDEVEKLKSLSLENSEELIILQLKLLLQMHTHKFHPKMACIISEESLSDPVALSTSPHKYYNRQELVEWVVKDKTDPYTRMEAGALNIVPKPELLDIVRGWSSIEQNLR